MRAYLSGAIEFCPDQSYKDPIKSWCGKWGIEWVDPYIVTKNMPYETKEECEALANVDLLLIRTSDFIIAVFHIEEMSGTHQEVFYGGRILKIPVFTIWLLPRKISSWVLAHSTKVYKSFEEFKADEGLVLSLAFFRFSQRRKEVKVY